MAFDLALAPEMSATEIAEPKSARWQQPFDAALHEMGKCLRDAQNSAKGAEWKIAIAGKLRQSVAAPYRWIAETLNIGHPGSVRGNVARLNQRSADPVQPPLRRWLHFRNTDRSVAPSPLRL